MILDSSAILAIVLREHGWEELVVKLVAEPTAVGAPTHVETGLVLTARTGKRRGLCSRGSSKRPVSRSSRSARSIGEPRSRPMRGSGRDQHAAARLKSGDCLTYAIARLAGQPLLFVGTDFSKTDLPAA